LACPHCGGDFIEEIGDSGEDNPTTFVPFGVREAQGSQPPPPQPPPFFPFQATTSHQGTPIQFQMLFGNHGLGAHHGGTPTQAALPVEISQFMQQVDAMLPLQQQQMAPVMQVFATGSPEVAPMNFPTFVQSMLANLGLHDGDAMVGNPGDYVFGSLDNIITRLMEAAGDRGPPPAAQDVVEALPPVRISQEAVDAHENCAICKEEYALNDEALQLACEHLFHPTCIKEWLMRRNTCPVCRFQLKAGEKIQSRRNDNNSHDRSRRGGGGGGGGGGNEHNSADSPFQFYS
jgi:E3 ubiquitin-protein ligase RNF115/126